MDSIRIRHNWYPDKLSQKETEALRVRRRAVKLDDAAPQRDTLGVALSGGGIRSATFSLGLLQALAKAPKVGQFSVIVRKEDHEPLLRELQYSRRYPWSTELTKTGRRKPGESA